MKPRLTREGDLLVVDLAGIGKTEFEEALPRVKAIPGRRYNPDRKVWEFQADPMTAHKIIHQVEAQPTADILGWVRQEMAKRAEEVVTKLPKRNALELVYDRRLDLYPHQVDAVGFLAEHPRAILADDMGLGKTVEAIATVEELSTRPTLDKLVRARPRLVVAPASLVGNWRKEIEAWAPGAPVFIIPGRATAKKRQALLREALATPSAWIIVNYEQIRAQYVEYETDAEKKRKGRKGEWRMKEPLFAETEWAAVILDEAHRIKNRHAQQTRGAWMLNGAPVLLLLTGTPVLNSPDELWPGLVLIRPEQYGEHSPRKIGYHAFFNEYVEASEGHYGKIVTGVKNADALRFELSDKLVRRTKGQVLDLPPKIRTTIPLELNPKQAKLYSEAEKDFFLEVELALPELSEAQRKAVLAALALGDEATLRVIIPNAAARLVRLQQILETPALLGAEDDSAKLDAAVEKIADNPDRQFVVFTKFKGTTGFLAERLRKRKLRVATLTGDTPPEDRTLLVAQFQAGELDVLVATIEAGGVGLTLTASDTAIFITRHWTPGINEQAEDRLHRIGQDSTVNVLILEAQDSVDDGRVAPKNLMKELTVGAVIQQDHIERIRAA